MDTDQTHLTQVVGTGLEAVPVEGQYIAPIGVTIPEAMQLLRIGRKTLERLIDRGDIAIFTIGATEATGGLRVNYQSLLKYAELRKVDPTKRHPRR